MKIIAIIIINICFFTSLLASEKKNITVQVKNIEHVKGYISFALHNNENDFPKNAKKYRGKFIKVTGKIVSYTFKNIPKGKYAVVVYHDINSSKKLDRNIFGIPKESCGVSNDGMPIIGPPKFEEAAFILDEKDLIIKIVL